MNQISKSMKVLRIIFHIFYIIFSLFFELFKPFIYYIDRLICAFIPLLEVLPFGAWNPKEPTVKSVSKDFPQLSREDCLEIVEIRKKTRFNPMKNTFIRFGAFITGWLIWQGIKLIF